MTDTQGVIELDEVTNVIPDIPGLHMTQKVLDGYFEIWSESSPRWECRQCTPVHPSTVQVYSTGVQWPLQGRPLPSQCAGHLKEWSTQLQLVSIGAVYTWL